MIKIKKKNKNLIIEHEVTVSNISNKKYLQTINLEIGYMKDNLEFFYSNLSDIAWNLQDGEYCLTTHVVNTAIIADDLYQIS